MKELAYLNKYFVQYKGLLLLGILFTVLSNLFGIIPAQLVRHALELVETNVDHYFLFQHSGFQPISLGAFAWGRALYF